MYYELVSLEDYCYKFSPNWIGGIVNSSACCECGNILPKFRGRPIDVCLHQSEDPSSAILNMSFKVSINVIRIDLLKELQFDFGKLPKGKVYVGDTILPEYHSIVLPDMFRYKKFNSSDGMFRKCQCGRQLGGDMNWEFAVLDGVLPRIISTDIGYGIFVSEIVLAEMKPSLLDQLALHPRKVVQTQG